MSERPDTAAMVELVFRQQLEAAVELGASQRAGYYSGQIVCPFQNAVLANAWRRGLESAAPQ